MLENYFFKGLLIAIIFGVPAGTIGALTIERTLTKGFWAGFLTGLGSSVCDVIYAGIGAFGITIISDFFLENQKIISILGGIIIILLGITIFTKKTDDESRNKKAEVKNLPFCFISSFTIAILNPSTIISFLLAFSTFNIANGLGTKQGIMLIMGILIGTCVWWCSLSGIVVIFKKHISERIYQILNRCLGGLLIIFAIGIIINVCILH